MRYTFTSSRVTISGAPDCGVWSFSRLTRLEAEPRSLGLRSRFRGLARDADDHFGAFLYVARYDLRERAVGQTETHGHNARLTLGTRRPHAACHRAAAAGAAGTRDRLVTHALLGIQHFHDAR